MKVAVVGVTGLVGTVMNKVLEERDFPISEYMAVASERSVGKDVCFRGENHTIIGMAEAVERKPDIALFSAGGSVSLEWAPKFAAAGTVVIPKNLSCPRSMHHISERRIKLLPIPTVQLFKWSWPWRRCIAPLGLTGLWYQPISR